MELGERVYWLVFQVIAIAVHHRVCAAPMDVEESKGVASIENVNKINGEPQEGTSTSYLNNKNKTTT